MSRRGSAAVKLLSRMLWPQVKLSAYCTIANTVGKFSAVVLWLKEAVEWNVLIGEEQNGFRKDLRGENNL